MGSGVAAELFPLPRENLVKSYKVEVYVLSCKKQGFSLILAILYFGPGLSSGEKKYLSIFFLLFCSSVCPAFRRASEGSF